MMSSKRKKSYYKGSGSAKHYKGAELQSGAVGYIFSIAKDRERQAKVEATDLLNSYAVTREEDNGATKSDSEEDSEEDIQVAMEKQLAKLKEKKRPQSMFSFQDTGVNQIMFMKTSLENHYSMTYNILDDAKKGELKTKCRYLNRIVPVLASCRAEPEKIRECVSKAVNLYLTCAKVPTELTYKSQIKVRNNTDKLLSHSSLITVIGEVMRDEFSDWKVNLGNPSVYIMVDILKTVCCVSVIHDYIMYKKFNIQELVVMHSTGKAAEKGDNRVKIALEKPLATSSHCEVKMEGIQIEPDISGKEQTELGSEADSEQILVAESPIIQPEGAQAEEVETGQTTDTGTTPTKSLHISPITNPETIPTKELDTHLDTDSSIIQTGNPKASHATTSEERQEEEPEKDQSVITDDLEPSKVENLEPDTS